MIPYEGNEPYIFVSYAHKDSDRVLPLIEGLSARGYRVWYDAGIEAGTEWPDYIAEHLENAAAVLAFLSASSLASVNCRQEIMYALDLSKPTLTAYLEDVKLTGGMRMRLGLVQAIFRPRHTSDGSFLDELCRASLLAPCKGEAPKAPKEDVPAAKPPKAEAPAKAPAAKEETYPMPQSTKEFRIEGRDLMSYVGRGTLKYDPTTSRYYTDGTPTKVTVPLGVEVIRGEAFKRSPICEITLPQSVKELHAWSFANCVYLTHFTFPEGMTRISSRLMVGCERLATVKLPSTAKEIGSLTFSECSSLAEIEFPEGLEEIGDETFRKCTSLKSVTFPKSLKSIGEWAFAGCKKLKTVTIHKGTKFVTEGKKTFPSTAKIIYL